MSDEALTAYREARDRQLVRNEARHIRAKINDARGSRHDAGVRWPFELLQNALDAGPRPGRSGVDVKLFHHGVTFVFEHDGAFFTLRELAALLSGGSSKEFESDDTTGRFGTGFLVTHVLAPRATVSGIFTAGGNLERFELVLDRAGDEDSIVANIEACDVAIRSARPLSTSDEIPSASFTYVADDTMTLRLGMESFRAALPYLFATCDRLNRVSFEMETGVPETWEAGPVTSRTMHDALVRERTVWRRGNNGIDEYRTVRVAVTSSPKQTAVAVLLHDEGQWRLQLPGDDFPRLFSRYPIRSSTFLPVTAILDAPFDLDQERRRILLDKEEVKAVFHASSIAIVPLVRLAYEEGWVDRHWLARAAPCASSFADKEDEQETAWLTGEMRHLAHQLARLPLVTTRKGLGASLEGTEGEWYADFVDADIDGTTMDSLWPLVDDAEDLYPPVAELAEAWATIAQGWIDLGVQVNQVGLTVLVKYVGENAQQVDELRVRCDKREWITRFLDVVGECWAARGVKVDIVERMLPNQSGSLVPLKDLKRDEGIPDALKAIADALGCGVRSRLLDLAMLELARKHSLAHVEGVLKSAVPAAITEENLLDECVRLLERRFPKVDRLSKENEAVILASIQFLDYLARKGDAAASLASRVPLLTRDKTFARTSAQRKMMAPVEVWDERARSFHTAYPPDRVLASDYVGTNVVAALVDWGIGVPGPLIKAAPSDPIKDDRLRCLAVEGEETDGVQVHGEEFTQIALLHELIPRCQERDVAASLAGLVLCYIAPADDSWRDTRIVKGRRSGVDVPLTVRGALWFADLRTRAWVPVLSDEGRISPVVPTPESLRSLLDSAWLRGNTAALELLRLFGFDALDLQLLTADDDETRQGLRDRLARIAELAGANPAMLVEVEAALEVKKKRAQDVARCRKLGLDIQAAMKLALEGQGLTVEIVDVGYDFDVSYSELDDGASAFQVGPYLVEVKATTQGDARLTPKQAETASQQADRYVLCVVDLRGVSEARLDQPWSVEDVRSLARLVPQIGGLVQGTWKLVEEARTSEVALRNENALRYAVPPDVWEQGCSMGEWVAATFR